MYEDLKAELQQIVELVESIPERYRDRCFDVLLSTLLSDRAPGEKVETGNGETKLDQEKGSKPPPIPAKVRAFIGRNNITDEELRKLLLIEGGELHFIHEPQVTQNAAGQIQWSLLLALKSALLGRELEVDAESARSVCIEKGFYDKANFASNFKKPKNAALFQEVPEPHGNAVRLSSAGERRLAELVKSLVA